MSVAQSMPLRDLILVALLAVAVFTDIRSRRIPNILVVLGVCLGLGSGNSIGGLGGVADSALGGCVGLAVFLPLYALRWLGAGDVKLLAMIGTFVGLPGVLWVAIYTAMIGGVLGMVSMALASSRGRFALSVALEFISRFAPRVRARSVAPPVDAAASAARGKLPYAVALCLGTLAWLGPRL